MKKDNLQSKGSAKKGLVHALRTRGGFTMAEILIALTILTIGLVSILSLFPVGLKASKRAGDLNEAALCTQEVLEKLKVDGYANLSSGTYTISDEAENLGIDTNRYTIYLQEIGTNESEYIITSPMSGLKEIELTIIWEETGSANKNEEVFKTYVANYD